MIYIFQLIYVHNGHEEAFEQFEAVMLPAVENYNGYLLFRQRVDPKTFAVCNIEIPYEIHLVKFNSEEDFEEFLKDEGRRMFLHLKQQSVRATFLIKGKEYK